MTNDDRKQMLDDLLKQATTAGASEADAFMRLTTATDVNVRDGEIEKASSAMTGGVSLRVFRDGRAALTSTSDLREESLAKLAKDAVAMLDIIAAEENIGLPKDYGKADLKLGIDDPDHEKLDMKTRVEMATRLENGIRGAGPEVRRSDGASWGDMVTETFLASSSGWSGHYRETSYGLSVSAIASKTPDSAKRTGWASERVRMRDELPMPERVGLEAGDHAVSLIGAKQVSSRTVDAVFNPAGPGVGFWNWGVARALSGEQVHRGRSYLADKIGKRVASKQVTVIDDRTLFQGLESRPFDDEGVEAQRTMLIDNGKLRGYLHTSRSAAQMQAASTGAASRGEYFEAPELAPSNLIIQPGKMTRDELIADTKNGFLVMETMGFGTDPANDTYSMAVVGRLIENGKLARPVAEVTLAGRLSEMLMNIDAVASDGKLRSAWGGGAINTPTFRVTGMTLSGG